jgi:transposase InsO family protein
MSGISYETKKRIVYLKGEERYTYIEISEELNLSYSCVRKWYRRHRDKGEVGLKSKSHSVLEEFEPIVRDIALKMKKEHKNWGAKVILTKMKAMKQLKGKRLPSRSRLYDYYNSFEENLLKRRNKDKFPKALDNNKAKQPNECWQADFKEKVKIKNVGEVSILNIRDEGSALTVGSHAVKSKDSKKAPALNFEIVRENLRISFQKRGLPDRIRTDRGSCFVGHPQLKFPGLLTLWLKGLGIEHIINKPHSPKQNAEVERYNQTYDKMFLKEEEFRNFVNLKQKSDEYVDFLNDEYPTCSKNCNGVAPSVANPEIYKKRRTYSKQQETEIFNINHVKDFLAEGYWERPVNNHWFSFINKSFRLSFKDNPRTVCITYSKEKNSFLVSTKDSVLLKEIPATFINVKELTGLDAQD